MRVLLLLLLVISFSATAQVTKTITGTVSHERGQKKLNFETPNGKVKIYLPDDMAAGDVITGTIVPEPAGKNQKEIQKNLSELRQLSLQLGNARLTIPGALESFMLNLTTVDGVVPGY